MRYTALILKGFKRFALNQVVRFEIRPREQIQLILGTNGSGKSSLLQELTPLPANPADYLKDGCKEIHIVDRGFTYILVSNFAVKQIHSFQKDGEELNPGGTASVQKELVRQHFGITPDIHELEVGEVRLTDLGPGQRREWFTLLSDVSYDYAIGVFDKLSKEHRSVVGALDLDKRQLVVEQNKIITEEEQQLLIAEVKQLHEELSKLFEMRAPIKRPLDEVQSERMRTESQLKQISEQLLHLKVESPAHLYRDDWGQLQHITFHSIDDVQNYIEDIKEQITAQEAVLGKLVTDHSKLEKTVDILKRQGADGIESVRKKIAHVADLRLGYLKERRLKLELDGADPGEAHRAVDAIRHDLNAVLSELPMNSNKGFSSAILQEMKTRLANLRAAHQQHTTAAAKIQAQLAHFEEHKKNGSVTCPKCNHTFVNGLSEEKAAELKKHLAAHTDVIEGAEMRFKSLEAEIADQENYGALFRQFIQITRSTPSLRAFWGYVTEKNWIVDYPNSILSTLQVFEHDLGCEIKAKMADAEIDELKKLLAQSEQLGDQNINDAIEKLNTSTIEIGALTKTITNSRKDLNEFYVYRKQLETAISLEARVREYIERLDMLTHDVVETMRLQLIQQCIQHVQSSLARKEETLNQLRQQRAIVENLGKIIGQRTKEEQALKATIKALSPKDGLIAEGLFGFIRHFTLEMNQLIRKIWAYLLEVQPCGVASERGAELDYKFPMAVGSRDNIIPDVSRGSSGMQEIINLAWKVLSLKYLGLEHGVLKLDEFGKTLDLEHRTAAIMAIKTLMETKPFTQLYMISHYESHYGAFTNAEVCVLDARNIATPKVYNQHVVITN
jgi:DNA repair exonuclease SbcCD ATPase subunit